MSDDKWLPVVVVTDESWRDAALCAQTDPEAFYPEKGGSTREAKKVCASCGVRDECLQSALDADERFGIWGGLSERERRKLHKATPKVCALDGCDLPVPLAGDRSDRARRYCTPAHGRLARPAAATPAVTRRELPCPDCGRRFGRPCDLARHAKAAHRAAGAA